MERNRYKRDDPPGQLSQGIFLLPIISENSTGYYLKDKDNCNYPKIMIFIGNYIKNIYPFQHLKYDGTHRSFSQRSWSLTAIIL